MLLLGFIAHIIVPLEQGPTDELGPPASYRGRNYASPPLLEHRGGDCDRRGRREGAPKGWMEQGVQCVHQVLCSYYGIYWSLFCCFLGICGPCVAFTGWPPQQIFLNCGVLLLLVVCNSYVVAYDGSFYVCWLYITIWGMIELKKQHYLFFTLE